MRTPAEDLEPVVVDPRKLRRTAWILGAIMLIGGFTIYFSYLKAAERDANDDRPSIVARLSKQSDFGFFRQDGTPGKMSELYGGVWLVCGFSAKQPESWQATREVLKRMSERYADRTDFHILCLTVDPQNEDKLLAPVADELGAKLPQWWFASAGQEYIQKFLKNDLKLEIIPHQENGQWVYDPTVTVIDRDLHLRKGTVKVSKHQRKAYPFNFEQAAKDDRSKSRPFDDLQSTTKKLEELMIQVIDYTLAQPITSP
jgi:cytochrome oxidase Cu insertion factor (SCO1/SenC/PrrC family)